MIAGTMDPDAAALDPITPEEAAEVTRLGGVLSGDLARVRLLGYNLRDAAIRHIAEDIREGRTYPDMDMLREYLLPKLCQVLFYSCSVDYFRTLWYTYVLLSFACSICKNNVQELAPVTCNAKIQYTGVSSSIWR